MHKRERDTERTRKRYARRVGLMCSYYASNRCRVIIIKKEERKKKRERETRKGRVGSLSTKGIWHRAVYEGICIKQK